MTIPTAVKSHSHPPTLKNDRTESRLLVLAAIYLLLFSVAITLARAGRQRTLDVALQWQHWLGYFIWLVAVLITHRQLVKELPDRDPSYSPW